MSKMTTQEIRSLLNDANLDFETIVNRALNNYLSKIFPSCPITETPCVGKQCVKCNIYRNNIKNMRGRI